MRRFNRSRTALVAAMLGQPAEPMPAIESLDMEPFWRRFDRAAPLHLRVGYGVATVAIAILLPALMGQARLLGGLTADEADRVIQRAASLPGFRSLAELAKLVACFAYFSDDTVQSAVRDRR